MGGETGPRCPPPPSPAKGRGTLATAPHRARIFASAMSRINLALRQTIRKPCTCALHHHGHARDSSICLFA